jgi:hypothetical protein
MDPRIAALIFISYFVVHVLYVSFVRLVSERATLAAASCSVATSLINIYGIVNCVDSLLYLLPLSAGAFLGTCAAVHPEFSQRRLRMIRLFLIAVLAVCLSGPSADAGPIARVLTAPLRLAARVATAPVRAVRAVQLNSLERRACRGNRMAAARIEGASHRMAMRGYYWN